MSYSYAIVHRPSRLLTIVNGGPEGEVDVVVDIKRWESVRIIDYYEGIETEFVDDAPPYRTLRMIFTANNWSVVTATYLDFHETGLVMDYVSSERSHWSAFMTARLVLCCERLHNNLPKVIEDSVKTSKFGKEEEDEEICAICHEEYHAEDITGTLGCNHRYHDECIKNWMMKKTNCPICRTSAIRSCFYFNS